MARIIPTVLVQGVQTADPLELGLKIILTFSYSPFSFFKIIPTTKKIKINTEELNLTLGFQTASF